jgi:predicted RNA binding protein YcfA (HicA-like mRNA interferase family)
MTPRSVTRRIRTLDPTARVVHQDGSHQKWRLWNGTSIIVPVHSRDVPIGTLRSIERQGTSALGSRWLTDPKREG